MKSEKEEWSEKFSEIEETLKQWQRENPRPTLTQIEETIDAELAKLRQLLLEDVAQRGEQEEKEARLCPKCETQMVRNGQKLRQLRTKADEKISIKRTQMRCLECGMTLFPPR